jgi:hypothetical protein
LDLLGVCIDLARVSLGVFRLCFAKRLALFPYPGCHHEWDVLLDMEVFPQIGTSQIREADYNMDYKIGDHCRVIASGAGCFLLLRITNMGLR